MDSAPQDGDTEKLLKRASAGDEHAVEQLLDRHRQRLRRMVAVRLDPRLTARVDPSDVVQESLIDASRNLTQYLRDRPLPFYPWLRQFAWKRIVDMHRRHIQSQKRSVLREEPEQMAITKRSAVQLAECLAASHTSPSQQAVTRELRESVQVALAQLRPRDQEILILMYLEQLSTADIGVVLGITERAVTMRHLRALERIGRVLND